MLGKWKIKTLATYVPGEGFKNLTLDEVAALPDGPEKEELLKLSVTVMELSETSLKLLAAIPAEQLEAAKAAGAPVSDDGCILIQETDVKVENGEFYYDGRTVGTVMGEDIDPWQKIVLDENGDFEFNPMMTFEKIK